MDGWMDGWIGSDRIGSDRRETIIYYNVFPPFIIDFTFRIVLVVFMQIKKASYYIYYEIIVLKLYSFERIEYYIDTSVKDQE